MHFYGDDHLGSRRLVCRIQPRLCCSIEKTSCEPGSLNGDPSKIVIEECTYLNLFIKSQTSNQFACSCFKQAAHEL